MNQIQQMQSLLTDFLFGATKTNLAHMECYKVQFQLQNQRNLLSTYFVKVLHVLYCKVRQI